MAKLCAKGKAEVRRKLRVYSSACGEKYVSGVCSGIVKLKKKKKKKR